MANRVRITFKAKPRESFHGVNGVYFPVDLKPSHIDVIDDNAFTKVWLDCRDKDVMKRRREVLGIADYDHLSEDDVTAYGGDASGYLWKVSLVVDLKTGERSS